MVTFIFQNISHTRPRKRKKVTQIISAIQSAWVRIYGAVRETSLSTLYRSKPFENYTSCLSSIRAIVFQPRRLFVVLWGQLRWIILSVDSVQRRAKTHRFWNGGRKKTNPCATNVKKLRGFEWLFFTTADTSLTHQFHSYFIWFLIHARNEIDNFAVKKFSRNLFLFAQISNRFIFELRQKYT